MNDANNLNDTEEKVVETFLYLGTKVNKASREVLKTRLNQDCLLISEQSGYQHRETQHSNTDSEASQCCCVAHNFVELRKTMKCSIHSF
mgnify:CR=1 FL=1